MATVKRFEELVIWQMAEKQCAAFHDLAQRERFNKQFPLKDQMDRSSGSVMDNIAEGFDRYTRADFRHFLVMARGGNAEFRSQLYRCQSCGVITEAEFAGLKEEAQHLGIKINLFIRYLSNSSYSHNPQSNLSPTNAGTLEEPGKTEFNNPEEGYLLPDSLNT